MTDTPHDTEPPILASPRARRLADDANIDLTTVSGSGPHGRIIQRDIEHAVLMQGPDIASEIPASPTPPPAQTAAQTVAPLPPLADDHNLARYERDTFDLKPHDSLRTANARRLSQSKQSIPHVYLNLDCRLDALQSARARINAASPTQGPKAYKLSINDFLIKALALALQRVPAANVTWTENGMLWHRHSDVGVAVALDDGVLTPVIRNAELKTLGELSNEMRDLADRARRRRLAVHECQGGTTSISNLGMFGIKAFDAIINPPHATVLAIGAAIKQPLVIGDSIEIATVISCTLSCDQRAIDGAVGAEVLAVFRSLIEDPVRMLL